MLVAPRLALLALLSGSPDPEPSLKLHESRLPVLIEISQSGTAGPLRPKAGKDGRRHRKLSRRPFTLRLGLQGTQSVRVYATFDENDLERPDLFCPGCGMADWEGNKEWGLLMAEDGQGFNFWHYAGPDDHRCDPEPRPSSKRCWRTIWRINQLPLEKVDKDRIYLVFTTADVDPKTYEAKETYREVWELELAPPPPAPASRTR